MVTHDLDVGSGAFTGDPAGVVFGGGDFAVQGDGRFQGNQGAAGAHGMDEGLVDFGGGFGVFRG